MILDEEDVSALKKEFSLCLLFSDSFFIQNSGQGAEMRYGNLFR